MIATQLTDAQVAEYHENGFVVPDYHLSEGTLEAIRATHNRLIAKYPQFSDYCSALLPFDESFIKFARDENILNMVGQILGSNFALWNSSFFAKPAKIGTTTPWHQDGQYWAMRPLATCTVWMAIDDSTPENGCLRVIPGSHKGKNLRRHQVNDSPGLALNQELLPSEFDASKAVDMILKAGQISLHDVYLAHGSEPNQSDRPRRGMTLRFMPTSSYYDRDIEKERHQSNPYRSGDDSGLKRLQRVPLYLMRGVDLCGRNEYEAVFSSPAQPNPLESANEA